MALRKNLNPSPEDLPILLAWVRGKVMEYYLHVQPCEALQYVAAHADRINQTVYRYLRGQQTLDGTCSDLEVELSIKAYDIFKDMFRKEEK